MGFDGLTLKRVLEDIHTHFVGARVKQIYQLGDHDLLLAFRKGKAGSLLLSASPNHARLQRTHERQETPMQPPMFCMLLRKHLDNAKLIDVLQHGLDRVATLVFTKTDELGDPTEKRLIYEGLGKDANIILTDGKHTIIDALKHRSPFEGSERTMAPGATYRFPSDNRVNPFDEEALIEAFNTQSFAEPRDVFKTFTGVSPLFSEEFLHRQSGGENPFNVFTALRDEFSPTLVEGTKTAFAVYDLTHMRGDKRTFDDLATLLDAFFHERDRKEKRKQKAKDLEKFVKRQIDKRINKKAHLAEDLKKTETMDKDRKRGTLILAYQHDIRPGDRVLRCVDYETNSPMEIALDPTKKPADNAEVYFKRYKKRKNSIPHIQRQQRRNARELEYFRLIDTQIQTADLSDLDEIRDELVEHKYLRARGKKGMRRQERITTYVDSQGIEIMVGKNNRQNEKITHDIARHNHVWFHVQNAPGSHVVVKSPLPLSEETIRAAANLAALHSAYRDASSVPVDYTEVRHVKTIPGKERCFVRYSNQKTIYIDPDRDAVKALTRKPQ